MTKTTKRILPDLKTQRDNELKALRAELETAKQLLKKTERSAIKIGKAGGVSVYGLGRFPVTLYKSQWDKLLGMVPEIKKFIKDNESKLAVKE
jgi:hypothetical protein